MKHLNEFVKFDWDAFSKGKQYLVVGISEWVDFNSKAVLGTKVDCVIIEDKTVYKQKANELTTNLFEKISFKTPANISIATNSIVIPVGANATIYGEHRNMLSVKCGYIQVVSTSK